MTALDDLERIAREVTQPSPWTTHESDSGEVIVVDAHGMWVAEVGFAPQEARHIATFSPATVLALLAELRSARAVVAAAEAWRDSWDSWPALEDAGPALCAAVDAHRTRKP